MYCTQCGKTLTDPGVKFCPGCGAAVRSREPAAAPAAAGPQAPGKAPPTAGTAQPMDWSVFFQSLGGELLQVNPVSPNRFEFAGETKVKALLSRTTIRYKAVASIDPAARVIQWWEKLSESSFGIAPTDFGMTSEKRTQRGTAVEIAKTVRTPGGGYTYRYGDLRAVVENEARRRGWELRVALRHP